MILYHFCAKKHVKSILESGLVVGGVLEPKKDGFELHTGYIWLTADRDPDAQSWNTRVLVKHNRCAYRLTVEIPPDAEKNLMDRAQLEAAFPGTDVLFDGWEGSDAWRIYRGWIPKEWIRRAVRIRN